MHADLASLRGLLLDQCNKFYANDEQQWHQA